MTTLRFGYYLREVGRIARWASEEGPRSIFHQVAKRARLLVLKQAGAWEALPQKVSSACSESSAARWLLDCRSGRFLIGPVAWSEFKAWAAQSRDAAIELVEGARALQDGRFDLFEREHQLSLEHLPWLVDWQTGRRWSPAYFRTFRHHAASPIPGDIRLPWELARFSWLVPFVESALLASDSRHLALATAAVTDFTQKNPVAYTANWHPMECAMRILNLGWVVLLISAHPGTTASEVRPLLNAITLNAIFLSRTLEFTSRRNNHYTANLIGLAMAGHLLDGVWPAARSWLTFSRRACEREIHDQFHDDGVNIEGSIPYHRLVTELFLIGALIFAKEGMALPPDCHARLRSACNFTSRYQRPDGRAPSWGDNDGARVLCFDPTPIGDHRPLLSLAGAAFQDPELAEGGGETVVCALLGHQTLDCGPSKNWRQRTSLNRESDYFSDAGLLTHRCCDSYLFADFGGVGFRGLGGHGHNDTFSFELCLRGEPIIVDRGTPCYSANPSVHEASRSTRSHNTLSVDDVELAPMPALWRISNDALPHDVNVTTGEHTVSISGTHDGYLRLEDPVQHKRTLTFDCDVGRVSCLDVVSCSAVHSVKRRLHFHPQIEILDLQVQKLRVRTRKGQIVVVTWDDKSKPNLAPSAISKMFATDEPGHILILESQIDRPSQLEFEIQLSNPVRPARNATPRAAWTNTSG